MGQESRRAMKGKEDGDASLFPQYIIYFAPTPTPVAYSLHVVEVSQCQDPFLHSHTVPLMLVRTQIFGNRFFLSDSPGNQFLCTGQSRVTGMSGELSKSDVIGEKLPVLPPGYSVCEGLLTYNEEWDETVEL